MSHSTVLRICVVLEWTFVGVGLALSFLLESSLPEGLRQWLATEAEADLALQEMILLAIMIPLLLGALAGSIGLLLLKRWGAWLYLASLLLGYALLPFMGPTVEHALVDTVYEIATLLSGLILGLAFFSDSLKGGTADSSGGANPQ